MMCKHEEFIIFLGSPQSNREYWIMTEIFVYLHNGKDYCNCQKTSHTSDYAKCCQASIYFRDMLDPLVTKCPICGNTIA